ncbi:hypothetical protein OF83DRAFT_567307 [Amylostereum chailletii]|nr:hypothetical protein OF83DRAFT_567307 [Amylostereum chailletii]
MVHHARERLVDLRPHVLVHPGIGRRFALTGGDVLPRQAIAWVATRRRPQAGRNSGTMASSGDGGSGYDEPGRKGVAGVEHRLNV